MRRLSRLISDCLTRGVSTAETITNSFASGTDTTTQEAHPLLYRVPVLASRTVGREAEVRTLWQNLLSGRHLQVISGVDGIGKSTIAAEFCDAVRHSHRFSCIQWFSGQHALPSQLQYFFASMKGRKEKDVLLVIDDVGNPEEALATIPEHPNVYVVLTTSASSVTNSTKVACLTPTALSPQASQRFMSDLAFSEDLDKVFHNLGYVPLLMHMAALLVEGEVCSALQLNSILQEKAVRRDDTLSISAAVSVLLEIGVAELEKFPNAREGLRVISCFHLSDISDEVVGAVMGDAAGTFSVAAAQLGILTVKWEDSAFALHPLVAQVLRGTLGADVLHKSAEALVRLWPRRWRGAGSQLAYNLVWHTYAMVQHFEACGLPLTPAMITSMDRSSTFLAHTEARDLPVAASLWLKIHDYHMSSEGSATSESVRILRECGRLLHFLKHPRAEEVLQRAWQESVTVHGKGSVEAALILGCLGPYLPATDANVSLVETAVTVLEGRLHSVDVVLGKEEVRMLWQTVFILLMCKGQYTVEMGLAVPDHLTRALERADAEVKKQR